MLSKKRIEIEDNPNLVLVYQDEVHFQAQTTITAGWYKKGSAPKVKSLPGRDKVSFSGFVRPDTGALFTAKPSTFDYATTIDCVSEFVNANPLPAGMKYALVVDNAPGIRKRYD